MLSNLIIVIRPDSTKLSNFVRDTGHLVQLVGMYANTVLFLCMHFLKYLLHCNINFNFNLKGGYCVYFTNKYFPKRMWGAYR